MIYNGEVDTVENSDGDLVPTNTCTATGVAAQITYNNKNTFAFNTKYVSSRCRLYVRRPPRI